MSNLGDKAPLLNDPAREATASMYGYASQIWRSVLIWLRLQTTERMYLEGAEDIDVIHGAGVQTTQVKATTENITLRSANVIEAINNAWLHQERNPDWEIRYRYLTTAKIGLEQGDLLGLSMAGLEVWERARRATDVGARNADAERLRQFLLQEQRISSQVQAFLRDSDASGVWLRLVSKVEWDTDAAEAPDVVKEIKDELVSWGAERHVPTVEAEKVTAHLYEAAWSVATRRDADRFLVRADAIRIFDEKTQTSLPQATLLALFDALTRLPAGQALVAAPQLSMIGRTNVIRRAPSLTARHFSRSTLIGNIAKRAQNCATVILYGSTGTGKSTLAAEFVAATTEVWGWVDLRGLETDALTQRLAAVSLELKDEEGIRHLVLDDFDVPADSRALESDLVALARILDARAGRLLFTSTNVLPQRLGLALGVVSESSLQVPSFSRDEIAAFLIARGCAPGPIAQQWAMAIELHTQGHAQLVHARVAGLESMEFPQPSALDLTETPPEVQGARAEARRLLALLDPAARDLLCRLSVTVQAMQRSQVISIATQDPPIDDPGLAFDGLVGPWIETIGENLYRVSPLVQNAGVEIHGQAWAKGAHRTIARGLLILRTLTPSDFSSILLYSTAARDWGVIGQLSIGTFTADKDTWFALAEMEGWFVLMSVGEGVSAPKTDPFGLFLIRLLQFRLAAAKGDQRAATAIIVQFNKELPSGQVEQPLQFCRQFFLAQILLWAEVGLSVAEMVNIGAEYVNLSDTLSDIFSPAFREIPEHALQGLNRSFDAASAAGFALSNRVNDRPSVNDFLGACEPLAVPLVRRLLWFIGGTDAVASLLFKRTWLWESRQQPPDWEAARLLCMRAYSLGRRWELPGLTQAAACAAAQIVDEQFGGLEEALRLADQLAAEIGWSPAQEDGRAAILLRNGNFTSALDIWRRILPDWQAQSEFDLQQQYSCRDAAIAAGRLDRWGEAADWLAAARERTDKGANPIYEAALLITRATLDGKRGTRLLHSRD